MKREWVLSYWGHGIVLLAAFIISLISAFSKMPLYQVNKVNLVSLQDHTMAPSVTASPLPQRSIPTITSPPVTKKPEVKKSVPPVTKAPAVKITEPPKPKKMIEKPVPKKIIRTMAPPRTRPVFQMPEKSLKERLQEKLNQQEHSTTFVEPQRVLSKTSANPRTVISTEGFTHQWYLDILRSKISVNWDTAALGTYTKKRIYADCSFVVKRDGTIKNIKIIKSSGYSQFDTSVVMAVEASTPIPPLPDQYYKDELLVNIRFELE